MRRSTALDHFVADGDRQRRSHERGKAVARWWRSQAEVAALRRALADAPKDDALAVEAAVAAFIATPGLAERLIRRLIVCQRRDHHFEPPFRTIDGDAHHGLLLIEDRRAQVALSLIPIDQLAARKLAIGGRGSIGFTGERTLFRILRPGGARLSLWRAEPAGPDFTAANATPCHRTGEIALARGMEIAIDGRTEGFLIEQATGDILFLQATISAESSALRREYAAPGGDFLAATAVDGAASRLQMMATLLRALGRRDAAPAIAALADHPAFFVRWHMLRELAALDPPTALPLLRKAARGDPHPDIRVAAATALAVLKRRLAEAA